MLYSKAIDPINKYFRSFEAIHTLCLTFDVISVSYMLAFEAKSSLLWGFSLFCDVLIVVRILIRFHVATRASTGYMNFHLHVLGLNYVHSTFLLEFLTISPQCFVLYYGTANRSTQMLIFLRTNRFLSILPIYWYFAEQMAEIGQKTAVFRIWKYTTTTVLTMHVLACVWFYQGCDGYSNGSAQCRKGTWAKNEKFELQVNTSVVQSYVTSLYWVTTTLTGTGYGEFTAQKSSERSFASCVMVIGIAVFSGMIFGGLTSLLTNSKANQTEYIRRYHVSLKYLKHKNCPGNLLVEVKNSYKYLWLLEKGLLDTKSLFYSQLPIALRSELAYSAHKEMWEKTKIFKKMDPSFLRAVSLVMKRIVVPPNTVLFQQGGTNQRMYWLLHGTLEVLDPDGTEPVAILKKGKVFCELDLAFVAAKSATVKTADYCELSYLDRFEWGENLKCYGNIRTEIAQAAIGRCHEAAEIFKVYGNDSEVKPAVPKDLPVYSNEGEKTSRAASTIAALRSSSSSYNEENINSNVTLETKSHKSVFMRIPYSTSMDVLFKVVPKPPDNPGSKVFDLVKKTPLLGMPISNNHKFISCWDNFMIVFVIVLAFLIPQLSTFEANSVLLKVYEHLYRMIYVVYLLDLLISCRTKMRVRYEVISQPREIVRRYVRTKRFIVDIASTIPLELLLYLPSWKHKFYPYEHVFELNKLLKLYKFFKTVSYNDEEVDQNILINIASRLCVLLVLAIHWSGCVLYLVACPKQVCRQNSWVHLLPASFYRAHEGYNSQLEANMTRFGNETISHHFEQYWASLYFAAATLTSAGFGDLHPLHFSERLACVFLMLFGTFLFGYCTAVTAAILTNKQQGNVNFSERVNAIEDFMNLNNFNSDLQDRVKAYMKTVWTVNEGVCDINEVPFARDIPLTLQEKIAMHEALQLLKEIPMFVNTHDNFLVKVALLLKAQVYNPGEYITHEGDYAESIFLIRKGECYVVKEENELVLTRYGPGDFFGDLAAVLKDHYYASIQALSHVETLELSMRDLEDLLQMYPLYLEQFQNLWNDEDLVSRVHTETFRTKLRVEASLPAIAYIFHMPDVIKQQLNIWKVMQHEANSQTETIARDHLALPWKILSFALLRRTFPRNSLICKIWLAVQIVLSLIVPILIPLQFVLLYTDKSLWSLNHVINVVGAVCLYVGLHMRYVRNDGIDVTDPVMTAKSYLQTNFGIDLLSALPFDLIAWSIYGYDTTNPDELYTIAMYRLPQVIQVYRIVNLFEYLGSLLSQNSWILESVKFFLYTFLILFWQACALLFVACPPKWFLRYFKFETHVLNNTDGRLCIENSWLLTTPKLKVNNLHGNDIVNRLLSAALYFAASTSASVGYGDIRVGNLFEMFFKIASMIVGGLYFGFFIAIIAANVLNVDKKRVDFKNRYQAIEQYLRKGKVDEKLFHQIMNYYSFVWLRTKGYDPHDLFGGFPDSLWEDISYAAYHASLYSIHAFANCDVWFIRYLCKDVQIEMYREGDQILLEKDRLRGLYCILRGTLGVYRGDFAERLYMLHTGSTYGEYSGFHIHISKCSVLAETNCDLYVIKNEILTKSFKVYPEAFEIVKAFLDNMTKAHIVALDGNLVVQVADDHWATDEAFDGDVGTLSYGDLHFKHFSDIFQDDGEHSIRSEDNILYLSESTDFLHRRISSRNIFSQSATPMEKRSAMPTNSLYETKEQGAEDIPPPVQTKRTNLDSYGDKQQVEEVKESPPFLHFTINAEGIFYRMFAVLMICMKLASFVVDIYMVTFQDDRLFLLINAYIIDVLHLLEMFLKFHLTYKDRYGNVIEDYESCSRNYLSGKTGFWIDAVALYPTDIFSIAGNRHTKKLLFLRLNRAFRIVRILFMIQEFGEDIRTTMLWNRLLKVLIQFLAFVHCVSCVWYIIGCPFGKCKANSWGREFSHQNGISKYVLCIYWCLATMTTTGYGDVTAYSNKEMWFSVFVMLAGKVFLGLVLANVSSAVANSDMLKDNFQEKIRRIKDYMNNQNVGEELKSKILQYMLLLWFKTKEYDKNYLFHDAPFGLKAQLLTDIFHSMLVAFPCIPKDNVGFLRELSLLIEHNYYLPGDFLYKRRDISVSILFIKEGQVKLYVNDPDELEAETLLPGNFLGVKSLYSGKNRTFNALCLTETEILSVTKDDLDAVFSQYAELENIFIENIRNMLETDEA